MTTKLYLLPYELWETLLQEMISRPRYGWTFSCVVLQFIFLLIVITVMFTSTSSCSFWSLKVTVNNSNCFKVWWFSVFLFSPEQVMVLRYMCLGLRGSCAIPLKGGMFLVYLKQTCLLGWILCWVMYAGSAVKSLSHSVLLPICDESIIYMMKICHIYDEKQVSGHILGGV